MALVLTRREGEVFWIGDRCRVKVYRIGKGSVRLAIEAPKEVKILREEIKNDAECGNR